MEKALKTFLIGVLVIQILIMPVMTSSSFAQVFESQVSPPPSGITSPVLPVVPAAPVVPSTGSSLPSSLEIQPGNYFTDDMGNLLMYVNVWGEVGDPGQHIVREGADISTVISIVGGPSTEAELSKVRLIRHTPDEDGTNSYIIDLKKYGKVGDRAAFVELRPNDTIIVPEDRTIDTGTVATFIGLAVSIATLIRVF